MSLILLGCTQQTDVSTESFEEVTILDVTEEEVIESNKLNTVELNNEGKYIKAKTNNPHFNKNNLLEVSNISYDRLYGMLKSTALADLTNSFIKAEETYGVNCLAIVGIVALESSWGKSKRAIEDNNLSGYAIYNRGSSYSFSSKEESIMETTRLLKEDYLNFNGKYHNGKSLYAVNIKYCTSMDWNIKVNIIVNQLLKK